MGSVITFGKFRPIDLGDLLWNKERDLMCPNNLVGTVDLYIASHHGIDASGSAALVHGLQPRVAIEQNGTRKGGTLQTNKTIYSSPGFEDLWQMHWSYNAGTEYNPAGLFIANIDEPAVIAAVLTAPPGGGRGGPGGARLAVQAPAALRRCPGAPAGAGPAACRRCRYASTCGHRRASAGTPPAPRRLHRLQGPAACRLPGLVSRARAPPAGAPPAGRQGGGGRGGPGVPHTGPAFMIKVSAQADGTFTVTNTRNGFSRDLQTAVAFHALAAAS